MSADPITIILLGRPVPWARAGGGKSRGRFTPQEQRRNADTLATMAQQEMRGREMFDEAVTIEILAEYPIPKSWPKKKQHAALLGEIRYTNKPDWENLAKQICDALTGVVYMDDKLIDDGHLRKRYSLQPKLVITVSASC